MSKNYELFLEVLRRWPVNSTKKGRDYGHHLRTYLKSPNEECFPGTKEENSQKINSLLRLTENKYYNMSSSQLTVGSTGLELEKLNLMLIDAVLKKYENA